MVRANYLQPSNGDSVKRSYSVEETKRYLLCKSGKDASKSSSSSSSASSRRLKFLDRPPRTAIPDIRNEETKRYLLGKSGKDASKSSSSSSSASRRLKFLDRPPRTAIPDIRNSDDILGISQIIGQQGFAEQTVFYSRQDCLPEGSYLIKRKLASDKDSDQDCLQGGVCQRQMVLERLCSPCTADHTFLVTRCSGPRVQRLGAMPRPKVSTISTSTDELYSSTGTVEPELTFACSEPGTLDATTCTNSCSVIETTDATTVTDMPELTFSSTGTQSYLRLIGVSDLSQLLDQKEDSKGTLHQIEAINLINKIPESKGNSEAAAVPAKKISSTEGTQSDLSLIRVGDLSKCLDQTKNSEGELRKDDTAFESILKTSGQEGPRKGRRLSIEDPPKNIPKTLDNQEKSPRKGRRLSMEDPPKIIPKTPENQEKSSPRERDASIEVMPKTPENDKKGSRKEHSVNKEIIPKTPENQKKGSPKGRNVSIEVIPKTPDNQKQILHKKDGACPDQYPEEIYKYSRVVEVIRKSPELHKGLSKERKLSVESIPKTPENRKKGLSKERKLSVESIPKSPENKKKGPSKEHNVSVEAIPKSPENTNKGPSKERKLSVGSNTKKTEKKSKGLSKERNLSVESIPKTPEKKKQGESKERKSSVESNPKTPENKKKGSLKGRKLSVESIPKTPENKKKVFLGRIKKRPLSSDRIRKTSINGEVSKKIGASLEHIRKSSENKTLRKGTSKRSSSIECIPICPENKGLLDLDDSTVENFPSVAKVLSRRNVVIIRKVSEFFESRENWKVEDEDMDGPRSIK